MMMCIFRAADLDVDLDPSSTDDVEITTIHTHACRRLGRETLVRRIVSMLALSVGACLAMSVLSGHSAHAVNAEYTSHTWNLAMGNGIMSGADPLHRQHTQETVLWSIAAGLPWTASLQEACMSQVSWLASSSSMPAMASAFSATRDAASLPPWSQCGGSARGNAVFAIGNYVVGYAFVLLPYETDATPETRVQVCERMQSIGFNYDACSTHLSNSSSTAQAQATYSYNNQVALSGSTFVIVGGDFNQVYPTTGLSSYWFTAVEMHLLSTPNTRASLPGSKIDYLFSWRPRAAQGAVQSPVFSPYSDHRYCIGHFTFT
jgi:hypothetical protein